MGLAVNGSSVGEGSARSAKGACLTVFENLVSEVVSVMGTIRSSVIDDTQARLLVKCSWQDARTMSNDDDAQARWIEQYMGEEPGHWMRVRSDACPTRESLLRGR